MSFHIIYLSKRKVVEEKNKIVINQVINVLKEGQKAIIIGKGAHMIKKLVLTLGMSFKICLIVKLTFFYM